MDLQTTRQTSQPIPPELLAAILDDLALNDLDAAEPTDAEWRAIVRHDLRQAELI